MKPKLLGERGQALVIFALAAIGIFGVVALAIDGSAKFSDRRHAQNAADTAAMAAALAKVNALTDGVSDDSPSTSSWATCPPPSGVSASPVCDATQLAGLDRANSNGYDDNPLDEVEVYSPPISGYYAGNPSYVQVIITSTVNTYFARVVGIDQTQNTVEAVALAKEGSQLYGGHTIVALNPNPCSGGGADANITLGTSGGGSGTINFVGGGMYLNSGGSGCGMNLTGCPVLNVTGGAINSVGNGNVDLSSSSGTCAATVNVPSSPNYDQPQYQFPPYEMMPEEPSECDSPTAATYSSNSATQVTTLDPGKYYEFPPKGTPTNPVYNTVKMKPGVYCVQDMVKLNNQNLTLTGSDVTIYMRAGYKFDIQGGTIQLDAPNSGPYKGYLIIVDSDFTGSSLNCNILGNGSNVYTGTIFAPYCNVTISGTSSDTSYSIQVIAYTVKIVGSATVNFTYDPSVTAENFPGIGLMD